MKIFVNSNKNHPRVVFNLCECGLSLKQKLFLTKEKVDDIYRNIYFDEESKYAFNQCPCCGKSIESIEIIIEHNRHLRRDCNLEHVDFSELSLVKSKLIPIVFEVNDDCFWGSIMCDFEKSEHIIFIQDKFKLKVTTEEFNKSVFKTFLVCTSLVSD